MTELQNQSEPQSQEQEPRQKKSRKRNQSGKRYYHFRMFWIFIFILIGCLATVAMNWAMNNPEYQQKAAAFVYKTSQTKLDFTNIHFNLFTGEVSGHDLKLDSERVKLKISLKEFTLEYNPFYLWIGRFKITKIFASEFVLDTTEFVPVPKKQDIKGMPAFLKHVHLKEAKITKFYWKQPKEGTLSIEDIRLNSRFGSVIYTSPLSMLVKKLDYRGPKLHVFLNQLEMEGFFLFDFSQPLIFDQTKLSVKLNVEDALLAFYRTPKPWLTDDAWDKDLEPILHKYYKKIPEDHTYFSINQAYFDLQKTQNAVSLNSFRLNIHGAVLMGKGRWQMQKNDVQLKLYTKDPVPLSKMPLGQSKFRQSFEKFSIALEAKGQLESLDKNNVNLDVQAKLINNLSNPPAGDVSGAIKGKIVNGNFSSDHIKVNIRDGSIEAKSHIVLKTLTTQTSFFAKNLDVQTVIRLFSSVNIPSIADGSGTVTGSLKNPRISVDLQTPNATYEFLNFGRASGNLNIDNKKMRFTVETVNSEVGKGALTMEVNDVFNPMIQVMDLKSSFENINIQKLLLSKRMNGAIGGKFDLTRNKGVVSANGKFLANDFTFIDHPVGFIDFAVNIKRKHAEIKPIVIELKDPQKTLISPTPLVFDFDDLGYTFSGTILEGLKIKGYFEKAHRELVHITFFPNKLGLDIFGTLLPVVPDFSTLTGKAELTYNNKDPFLSRMTGSISEWEIKSPDGNFKLNKSSGLNYENKAFVFKNFDVTVGMGHVLLNGPLGLESNSNLKVKGQVDFTPLVDFNPFISESETPIEVDVTVKGDYHKPSVYGTVILDDDTIQFRKIMAELSELKGTLKFNGNRISSDELNLLYDDGPMTLKGYITTDYEKVTGADLSIKGREVPFYFFEDLLLVNDLDMTLKGHHQMTLAGDVKIVEGKYARNLMITNFFIKPMESEALEEETNTLVGLPLNTRYNLRIKNTGDMMVKNNLADLEMNLDLDLKGTFEKPKMLGQIDVLGGAIHAFGITFDDASGFMQFNQNSGLLPSISLSAKKEIQGYNIDANIDGKANNLRLRLFSSPALDHRDILSLVFYGQTPDQLTANDRRNFTQTAAISQLATILADPLHKLSGLDVVEVSSRYDRPQETVQRLSVGKKLSNRFDISFTTDLGIENPERAFELRYQVFENFYLIAAKDVVGQNRYRFDVNLRFEAY